MVSIWQMSLAHLEDIQMKLDWEVFPPRGAAGGIVILLPPTHSLRGETLHSAPPGGYEYDGMSLSGAVVPLALGSIASVLLLVSCIPRPCCKILHPFLASCNTKVWAAHPTHTETQTQPPKGSRSTGEHRNSQQRQMLVRLAAEAQREVSYLALGKRWSGKASGRR